ncbi:MAG: DnaD domain protein [Lachnospiraceae bacterium]|nr:DnaD domain protein [Lachnospiraceae bacterium]
MGRLNIYSDNYNGATVISNRFFDVYMKDANDAQLKVYLYLVRAMNANMDISISDIADKFNHTERDIIRSLKYWEKMHLLQLDYDEQKNIIGIHMEDLNKPSTGQVVTLQPKTNTPAAAPNTAKAATNEATTKKPSYTAADMEKFASNEEFVQIRFVAETYLGKLLSGNELKSLLFIYDELKMSMELMDYLIEYCAGKDKKDLRYIEKVAMDWTDNGIKTVRQAKLRSGKYDKTVYAVMKALGKNNAPTETETAFISKWMNQYCFSPDLISFACEKTVLATDSHRMEYADGILTRWHDEGLKTREQIQASEQKYKQEKKSPAKSPAKPSATANNRFNDFKQNSYDFVALEQELLSN